VTLHLIEALWRSGTAGMARLPLATIAVHAFQFRPARQRTEAEAARTSQCMVHGPIEDPVAAIPGAVESRETALLWPAPAVDPIIPDVMQFLRYFY
jgi:hypothetical protein